MRMRTTLAAVMVIAASVLLGGLTASNRPSWAVAQDRQPAVGPLAASVLPYPEPPFRGTVGRTTADSKSDFPQPVQAPKGAPNVLLLMTDDVGFGASSTFGGPIPTPSLDRVAKSGLRYKMFH